jgi:hypothetical protein
LATRFVAFCVGDQSIDSDMRAICFDRVRCQRGAPDPDPRISY